MRTTHLFFESTPARTHGLCGTSKARGATGDRFIYARLFGRGLDRRRLFEDGVCQKCLSEFLDREHQATKRKAPKPPTPPAGVVLHADFRKTTACGLERDAVELRLGVEKRALTKILPHVRCSACLVELDALLIAGLVECDEEGVLIDLTAPPEQARVERLAVRRLPAWMDDEDPDGLFGGGEED